MRIRLVLIDNHALFRYGIKALLAHHLLNFYYFSVSPCTNQAKREYNNFSVLLKFHMKGIRK